MKELVIKALVSEITETTLKDVFKIYKDNYPELKDAEVYGYMVEDMLAAYLEGEYDEDADFEDDEDDEVQPKKSKK